MFWMRSVLALLLCGALSASAAPRNQKIAGAEFVYDQPDRAIEGSALGNQLYYEPGIAVTGEGTWMTWLEFHPAKGDVIWVGLREDEQWKYKKQVTPTPGAFARPTITTDSTDQLWLTYEMGVDGKWEIYLQPFDSQHFGKARRIDKSPGSDINHSVAADPNGGLWIAWQQDRDGQFDIAVRHATSSKLSQIETISDNPRGDWQPHTGIAPDGRLFVTWDAYDGHSYNVLMRALHKGKWSNISAIAATAAFEGRPRMAATRDGRLLVAWEEDGPNWGKPYRARTAGNKGSTRMGDSTGPLHRFRRLHLAEVDPATLKPTKHYTLPQPSLEHAAKRPNAPAGIKHLGAFYERPQLVVDGQDRPWLVYRHYYTPWMGFEPHHHVEDDFYIYARCLLPDGWSELVKFTAGQGDGMQRLSLAPTENGFTAAWTAGRTDRNKHPNRPRGVIHASAELAPDAKAQSSTGTKNVSETPRMPVSTPKPSRPVTRLDGKEMQLFFGDLHRHTDMSLCYTPSDGTIEDAYRYAIDAAPLDFLGITDHTHDLQMGDPLSQLWWRALKETDRHKLGNAFITFYSYERSRGDTDHNVISLRPDRMRPHTYPLPDFWQELDSDTFTIPHEPFKGAIWKHKDNAHRPLLEIYQGYRDTSAEEAALEGLSQGHEFGFIASSDHLSTAASFAGVWAGEPTRESVFRAMQARRTFGATAPIPLKVTCGNHWMGERFETRKMPPLKIEVTPTAAIKSIEMFTNGKIESSVSDVISTPGKPLVYNWQPKPASGPNIYYVRITQADGNRAWSSPIWVEIQ